MTPACIQPSVNFTELGFSTFPLLMHHETSHLNFVPGDQSGIAYRKKWGSAKWNGTWLKPPPPIMGNGVTFEELYCWIYTADLLNFNRRGNEHRRTSRFFVCQDFLQIYYTLKHRIWLFTVILAGTSTNIINLESIEPQIAQGTPNKTLDQNQIKWEYLHN